MKCKDFDTLLDSHRIGSLSAAEKADVASHLEQCRRCADAWLGHETLAGEMPAVPRAGLYAEALASAVAGGAVAADETAVAGGSLRRRAALGLAAAAVVVAGIVWFALPDEQTAEQGAVPAIADDSAESSAKEAPRFVGDTPDLNREPYLPPDIQERLERRAGLPTYVAGVHYETLAAPAPTTAAEGQVEVCEFFMFGCIHCFAFESVLTSWVESRADSVDFVRVPVMFNDVARLHAQAYYTAEALGVVDAIVGPFYSEIHERGQMLTSVDEIRRLFASYGIDAARFDATFNSEQVRGDLRRAEALNRLYDVTATPTIGVAGKYRTSVSMAGGSNEALFDVVDSLVEGEARAQLSSETESCASRNTCPGSLLQLLDQIREHAPQAEPVRPGERF